MSKPEPIEVYAVGASVLLDGTVTARVTAIFIRECVKYEVVWWNDRERKEEVVEGWEIQPDDDTARMQRINPVL